MSQLIPIRSLYKYTLMYLHRVHGFPVVSLLNCDSRARDSNPVRARIWFEISASPLHPIKLSYDKYTDRTQSVGRWDYEEDWQPALICWG